MTSGKLIAIGGLALVSVWITYPRDKIDISLESCEPSGALANLRSTLHSDLFWKNQRQALERNIAGFEQSLEELNRGEYREDPAETRALAELISRRLIHQFETCLSQIQSR